MKHPDNTLQWIDEELRRQGADPDEFRAIAGALKTHYAASPPGLDRAEAIPVPKLSNVRRVVRPRFIVGRRTAFTLAAAAVFAVGFFLLPRPAVHDSGRQLVLPLGEAIRGLATRGSHLGNLSSERAELTSGSTWFWVEKGGKGFLVATPLGDVRVTGTCFGVSVEGDTLRVDVIEGTVKVTRNGKTEPVTAGEELVADAKNDGIVAKRPEGLNPPQWVAAEIADQEKSWVGGVLPSVGVHRR